MKNSKYFTSLLFLLISCGGDRKCEDVTLEQTIEEVSLTNKESRITTVVSTKNSLGTTNTIEYIWSEVVKNADVKNVRVVEYQKAVPKYFQAIDACNCD